MTHALPEPSPEIPSTWVQDWPARFAPVRNGEVAGPVVEVFQHRPGDPAALLAWAGQPGTVNPDGALVIGGKLLLPLGDYLVDDAGQLRVEPAPGFHARYARSG